MRAPTTSVTRAAGISGAAILALAGVLGASGCVAIIGFDGHRSSWAYADDDLVETEHVLTHPVGDEPVLFDVEARNGMVSVVAADVEAVEVLAVVRTIDQERGDQVDVTLVPDEDTGWIEIRAHWPGGKAKNNEGVSFEITTPRGEGCRVASSNGSLRIEGLSGGAELRTSNGTITAEHHAGDVRAESSNGSVTLTDIEGDAHASTSNGRITAARVGGRVEAITSNAPVKVELTSSATGPVIIQTSNGSATLAVGPAFGGTVEYRTSNGSATLDRVVNATVHSRSKEAGTIEFSSEGPRSRVHTSNGSIRIKQGG